MPTITITAEQQAALDAGRTITVLPPVPTIRYNVSFIPSGDSRQLWHSSDVVAPPGQELMAAQTWLSGREPASSIRRHGGGTIVVAPRDRKDTHGNDVREGSGERYKMSTWAIWYFTVTDDLTIEPGIG